VQTFVFNIIIIYRNLRAHAAAGCCAIGRLINISVSRDPTVHIIILRICIYCDLTSASHSASSRIVLFSSSPSHVAVLPHLFLVITLSLSLLGRPTSALVYNVITIILYEPVGPAADHDRNDDEVRMGRIIILWFYNGRWIRSSPATCLTLYMTTILIYYEYLYRFRCICNNNNIWSFVIFINTNMPSAFSTNPLLLLPQEVSII